MRWLTTLLASLGIASAEPDDVGGLTITDGGVDLVVHFEVGGEAYYRKAYRRPIWPQGASGVTVGIGYDLGYNTPSQIRRDWSGRIPAKMVDALVSCSGIKGSAARYHQQRIRWIVDIPLDAAMEVFKERTLPRFGAITKRTFKTIECAKPVIQDMMLSQTYNRGSSTKGYSRRHVLWQARASAKGQYYALPGYVRDSKVVWANKPSIRRGIWRRRDAEADHGEGRGKFNP